MVKLLIGGSPCTHWSIAQKNNRETTASGIGWELFRNYLIAKEKFKPDYFLYENNKSAAQEIKDAIKEHLGAWNGTFFMADTGVRYIEINSALVSAQNRQRFYVHNCGEVGQPADRGISFQSFKDEDFEYCKKYKLKNTPSRVRMWNDGRGRSGIGFCPNVTNEVKTNCVVTKQDRHCNSGLVEFDGFCRYLTTNELEQLQTLPKGYTRAVNKNRAEFALGNSWTAEVVRHILWNALKGIPKDEKIVVCSMYDGIATGRYILDLMGFTNVEYHAYEIDKYAMQIAMSNYPDIIQHGDAFQVREDGWNLISS